MTPTLEEFKAYVGTDEDAFAQDSLDAGKALVDNYIKERANCVPGSIQKQAILIAGSELFHRRAAPNGIAQFSTFDGAPIRVARDPLTSVYPLLLPYVKMSL